MKLLLYFFAVACIQCGLGDPVIRYIKSPKPLTMKNLLKYMRDTSKVLEELAKEHLWLLSTMTATNNWNDLLGGGNPSWIIQRVFENPSKEEKEESFLNDEGEEEKQEKFDNEQKESPQIAGIEPANELHNQTQDSEAVNEVRAEEELEPQGEPLDVGSVGNDPTKTNVGQVTAHATDIKSQDFHSSPKNDSGNKSQDTKTSTSHKPVVNPKVGYSTEIGHGSDPDHLINYLEWKDKPIQHQFDPYGKPINNSDKLHTGSAKPKNPPVFNTKEKDLVFSPLPINERTEKVYFKPIINKAPLKEKPSLSPNPLARLNKIPHQSIVDTSILLKGSYNPLALSSSSIDDTYDDVDYMVSQILAETSLSSDMNHAQPDNGIKEPLDYPVQYYKSDALPDKHSKPIPHPAHHSRLEDNDIGW